MKDLKPTELMLAMAKAQGIGDAAGTWAPTPYDHPEFRRNRAQDTILRVASAVEIGCTRPGKRSAFAVTEQGVIWTVDDLCSEQKWSGKNARKIGMRALHATARAGLIRLGTIVEDVPGGGKETKQVVFWNYVVKNKGFKKANTKGEENENGTCTGSLRSFFAPYELEQVERFDAKKRAAAEKLAKEFPELADKAFNEAVSQVRAAIDQQKYNAKQRLGVKLKPKQEKLKATRFVKLSLLADLDPLAPSNGHSEQTANSVGRSVPSVDLPTDSSNLYLRTNKDTGAEKGIFDTSTGSKMAGVQVPAEPVQALAWREAVHALLVRLLGPKLHDEPSPVLCDRIVLLLQGAPIENLEQRIRLRFSKIVSMGMVEDLALDVGKAWKKQHEAAAIAQPARRKVEPETRKEKIQRLQGNIAAARAIADDKRYPPDERNRQRERIEQIRAEIDALDGNADAAGGGS